LGDIYNNRITLTQAELFHLLAKGWRRSMKWQNEIKAYYISIILEIEGPGDKR
jgi:hypothetical protein